jgi:hypothetical protein
VAVQLPWQPDPKAGDVPDLLVIVIYKTAWWQDQERGTVRDVVFRSISVAGKRPPLSSFASFDAEHNARGVKIESLRFNG